MVYLSKCFVFLACVIDVLLAFRISNGEHHYTENDSGVGDLRHKRAGVRKEVSYERKQPACQKKLDRMGVNGGPMQLVTMVETGETATFTCHYCTDKKTKFKSMIWHHLRRDEVSGRYILAEVTPDMHDKEQDNRVTVDADHTLVIRRAVVGDRGTYFCRDYSTMDRLVKSSMTNWDISAIITDKKTFRFLYHFDVLLHSEMDVREIKRSENSAQKPASPAPLGSLNLVMDTSWEKWSACSTCGKTGERKRLGVCYIRKAKAQRKVHPWYLEAVLKSYPDGVPCRSSLFHGYKEIKPRPDEIEAEPCMAKCIEGMSIQGANGQPMSVDGIKTSISFGQKKDEEEDKRRRSMAVEEGSTVRMNCTGVPVDWTVVWTNNTRVIDFNVSDVNNSDVRVTLHADNSLQINRLEAQDTGTYHCVSRGQVKVKIKLTVTPSMTLDTETWQYAYYMALSYPIDMAIFVLLMIVKHRHRRSAPRLTRAQLREINSFSTRSSNLTSDTDQTYDSHVD